MQSRRVKTVYGEIEGTAGFDPDITVFRGIPYATPPVGKLRWKPPQPPAVSSTLREAKEFGPICPQTPDDGVLNSEFYGGEMPQSEDCLYLNVWAPATRTGEDLPVLVWIHGGANVRGYSYMPPLDGEALCREGIIVVTINWRVGVLGWLATAELTEESERHVSGNYALLDQIAALRWVKENISAFGGDPSRVTIGGESAGASSVQLLCMTPLSEGLFHRAIMHSGGGVDLFTSNLTATLNEIHERVSLQQLLGVGSLKEARDLPPEDVVSLADTYPASGYAPLPVVDGYVLPGTMNQMLVSDQLHDVDYMIGNTSDETGMYDFSSMSQEAFQNDQRTEYGSAAEEYLALCDFLGQEDLYKAHLRTRCSEILRAGVLGVAEALENQGRRAPYVFEFARSMPGDDMGAYHAADLWYVFGTLSRNPRPFTEADWELSRLMTEYWAAYVKTGDPNGGHRPKWCSYTQSCPMTMRLDLKSEQIELSDNPRVVYRKNYVLRNLPKR